MEEWDVYYLFVRNINVTTNGSWLHWTSHTGAGNQLSPGREREVARQCVCQRLNNEWWGGVVTWWTWPASPT